MMFYWKNIKRGKNTLSFNGKLLIFLIKKKKELGGLYPKFFRFISLREIKDSVGICRGCSECKDT